MDQAVELTCDGGIATLTLARAASRNPLTDPEMLAAFGAALDAIDADPALRCVILTGSGPAFSAGGNLKQMRDREAMFAGRPLELIARYRAGIQQLLRRVFALELPLIAAVNGPAYGAGCHLALACDLRLAAQGASFAEPYLQLGIIAGDGGAWLLARAVGWQTAAMMSFTGEPLSAAEALDRGLVLEVVPDAALLPRARALAERIARQPPQQLRLTKRLLRAAQQQRLDEHLELAAALQAACHHSRDHDEAMAAFFEKRPPRFAGD